MVVDVQPNLLIVFKEGRVFEQADKLFVSEASHLGEDGLVELESTLEVLV